VVVGNPSQARDVARATGQLAKTEALDARALAHCADVIRPTPRPLPDAQPQELRALLGRRQPRIVLRTAEQHRLAGTSARLTKDIAAPMTWLNADIATLDDDLETLRRASPLWRENDEVLQRAKGIGPVWAPTLLLELPALGTRTRQHIAAWVGALTLLWAPLVSIGLLPFLAALAWRHLRAGSWRPLLSAANLLAAPLVALPSALYLTVAAGTIATVGVSGGALPPDWQAFLPVYARFMIVEFGALAVVLLYAHRDGVEPVSFGIAIACLLVLPWFHFGPNNDLVTRGSIPAFTILMFTVIDGWARPASVAGRGLIVTSLLVVGAIMPVARMGLVFARPV